MDIDTGDTVYHHKTGEEWLVAFVREGSLYWCGWPQGRAQATDCVVTQKATPEARDKLLHKMAKMPGSDPRKTYARARLGLGPNNQGNRTSPRSGRSSG